MTTNEEEVMTDDDPEINDDEICNNDNKFTKCAPFPNECDDEVKGIESFNACFEERYDACPVFYPGSLLSACESAFKSKVIEEHCPVLVYIHDDNSMLNNIFCKTTFCSETIIDYLLENYIVYPSDITLECNKTKLIQMWDDIFFNKLSNIVCTGQCPILIGIMRRSPKEKDWASKSGYQFKVLLKGDILMRTQEKSNRQKVLNELVIFKEECDENEQYLSFDFVKKTRFCWEIILEISKYLSLNDAINAFSDTILDSFQEYYIKVQICEPSKGFVNMILQKLNIKQIVSLHINTVRLWSNLEISYFSIFTDVVSLSLLNPSKIDQIDNYIKLFPKLKCLSLWYDDEVNFDTLSVILQQPFCQQIRRFEIHCAAISCPHYHYELYPKNFNVKYFLFDVRYFPLPSISQCVRNDRSCFLMGIIYFIKSINNIQYVRLVTNKHYIDRVSDWNQWKILLDVCHQLKRITIETLQSTAPSEQLVQKAMEIHKPLYT